MLQCINVIQKAFDKKSTFCYSRMFSMMTHVHVVQKLWKPVFSIWLNRRSLTFFVNFCLICRWSSSNKYNYFSMHLYLYTSTGILVLVIRILHQAFLLIRTQTQHCLPFINFLHWLWQFQYRDNYWAWRNKDCNLLWCWNICTTHAGDNESIITVYCESS
jgi:hypothetical protein